MDEFKLTFWDRITGIPYRFQMMWVSIKWVPHKFKIGWRNFKFGWKHPYPFDKINSIEEFVWMEFLDFMDRYKHAVLERASRETTPEPDDGWKEPSQELIKLHTWYTFIREQDEKEADRLFSISENMNRPKFEKVPGKNYYIHVENHEREEFPASERAAMLASRDEWLEKYRGNEKRYEENTNRLFALRGFLWD
jgi:hypothetical protein